MKKVLMILVSVFFLTQAALAQSAAVLIDRAKDSIGKNNFEDAVTDLSAALKLEPNNEAAYTQRARAYVLLKKFSAAFADAEKALSLNRKNVEALNVRGLAKVERKEIDSALADFTSAISIKPDFIKPYLNRAKIFIEKKEFEKAVADYDHVIKFDKDDGYLFYLRGSVYLYSIKNYDLAIRDYSEAIQLNPQSNASYFSRGQALSKKSSFNEAIKDYNKAIEIDPADGFSYYFRGNAYEALNKTEQAAADYKKALELDPKYEPFITALARITEKDSDQTGQITISGESYADKLTRLTDVFNPLSLKYTEKVNAMNAVSKNSIADRKSYCRTLIELDDITPSFEKAIDDIAQMYKSGEAAQVASGGQLEEIRKVSTDLSLAVFSRKFDVSLEITRLGCREKEVTLDEFTAAQKIETRNRIIEILKNLGNLSGYLTAGKKISALTTSSTQTEICQVISEFKRESDKIEPLLAEFAEIYVLEVAPEYADPNKPARTVEFDNLEITKQAEKLLELRTKLFLPKKEQLKNIRSKTGCQ